MDKSKSELVEAFRAWQPSLVASRKGARQHGVLIGDDERNTRASVSSVFSCGTSGGAAGNRELETSLCLAEDRLDFMRVDSSRSSLHDGSMHRDKIWSGVCALSGGVIQLDLARGSGRVAQGVDVCLDGRRSRVACGTVKETVRRAARVLNVRQKGSQSQILARLHDAVSGQQTLDCYFSKAKVRN